MTMTNERSEFGLELGEQGGEQHDCREHLSYLTPDGNDLDADIYICDVCGREFLMIHSRVVLLDPHLDVAETYEEQVQSVVDGYEVRFEVVGVDTDGDADAETDTDAASGGSGDMSDGESP